MARPQNLSVPPLGLGLRFLTTTWGFHSETLDLPFHVSVHVLLPHFAHPTHALHLVLFVRKALSPYIQPTPSPTHD